MNILCFLELYALKNKSGGELYIHNILKKLSEEKPSEKPSKKQINVLCDGNDEPVKFNNINVYETNEVIDKRLQYIDKCDILISQLKYGVTAINYGLSKNKKCILILHSYLKDYDKLVNNPKVIKIFNSNYVYKQYNNIEGEYYIIEPIIDYPKYEKLFNKNIDCREYITMINPSFSKGGDVFYQLCKYYKDRKFLVCEGGYLKHTQPLKKFRELSNVLVIKNTERIIEEVYTRSRIVIMPSRLETYGMVACEAASLGIPIILNKNTGLYDNIGKIGLYADTPENEVKNINQIKSYTKLIEILDDLPTYIIWSDFYKNISKEKYENQLKQLNQINSIL